MTRYVALLRAINLGATRKVPMARLRAVLTDAGFEDVVTHLQSGNVVLSSSKSAAKVAARVRDAVESEWGFDVPVIVRTRAQLAKVLKADPLGDAADDPSRYLVTFLASKPKDGALDDVDPADRHDRFALVGKELYTWTPGGVHDSKLLKALAKGHADVVGTARNWRTVEKLHELASE